MTQIERTAILVFTVAVAAGLLLPAGAAAGFAGSTSNTVDSVQEEQVGEEVSVEVGQQLSTVVTTTTEEVRSEAENAGFEQQVDNASATERAEVIAERADELENRSDEVRAEYDDVTESYRQDQISTSEFAQRIASLSAKATAIDKSTDQLADRASELPEAEQRAFGVTVDEIDEISNQINPLTGKTASTVLAQFTGEETGEIEIEVGDRIELSVSSDGEQSRQYERPRDGSGSYELNQSEALDIATAELTEQDGDWLLTSASTDDGAYEFEFEYHGAVEGEAEISVDGETGTVFELEESLEAPDEDDDDDEEEFDERLGIAVSDGEPAPGENLTLTVTASGETVENATVQVNERDVGLTDENGTIDVTLPDDDEAKIKAEYLDGEGELEFEFEEEEDGEQELAATADIEGENVTVTVLLGDEPLEGASVNLNGELTKLTDATGTSSFPLPAEELEIEIEYNDQETELEYELDEDEDEADDLELTVSEGEPAPGAEITLTATAGGEPVDGAAVEMNDQDLGVTDENGTIELTLPNDDEVDIKSEYQDAEGELEFEFEDEDDDEGESEADEESEDDEEDEESEDESETEEDGEEETEDDGEDDDGEDVSDEEDDETEDDEVEE